MFEFCGHGEVCQELLYEREEEEEEEKGGRE